MLIYSIAFSIETILIEGNLIHPLATCSNVGVKVYFADENVQFYELRHESQLRLLENCFLTF